MKILVADDEQALATGLSEVLSLYNVDSDVSFSAEEALLQLESNDYDAIVSDLRMPDTDGLEFLEILKTRNLLPRKFVFLSGYSVLTEDQSAELGVTATLIKPIRVKELLQVLEA